MDEILFLSYYFPPLGGAGVQRALKFCRYLPDEGILPVVVAGPRQGDGRWEPIDAEMLGELPETLPIFRPTVDPPPDSRGRVQRWLGRMSPRLRWWQGAILEAGQRALARHRPRAILVTLSPYEGLEPALELARRARLPLVADLRDPWGLDEVRVLPTALHRRAELATMMRLLLRCDLVIWNTPEALVAASAAFPAASARFRCLTNGYDAADFEGLELRPSDGRFRILHSGYLHAELGLSRRGKVPLSRRLGGELCPLDFLGRSHFYLLRALERVALRSPALAKRIDVHFLGQLSRADETLIRSSSVAGMVRSTGYLAHRETVRAQRCADVLFLPMHGLPAGRRARIVPAKTYEYLASGRPILAAVPPGDALDFVQAAKAGRTTAPEDVDTLADTIESFAAEAPAALRPLGPEVRRFERRVLTRELACLLHEVFESRRVG